MRIHNIRTPATPSEVIENMMAKAFKDVHKELQPFSDHFQQTHSLEF